MKKARNYILGLVAILLIAACQSTRSDYVLDEDEMEELLYDIHRAHFTFKDGKETRDDGAYQYALLLKILEKHNVTQAEWDSSMFYYCRNAHELQEIYANLTQRLEREAEAVGATIGSASSDTTDIWRDDSYILLTSFQPYTTRQWTLSTDTLLKAGEKITLRFNALFLQPNVNMRAECILAMRLANDSVVTTHQTLTRSGIFSVGITDTEAHGIKELKGMFMMNRRHVSGSVIILDASQILNIKDIVLLHELQADQLMQRNDAAAEPVERDTMPHRISGEARELKPAEELKTIDRTPLHRD